MEEKYTLSPEQLEAIQRILQNGDRVELIPAKEGVKIIQQSRKEVKF